MYWASFSLITMYVQWSLNFKIYSAICLIKFLAHVVITYHTMISLGQCSETLQLWFRIPLVITWWTPLLLCPVSRLLNEFQLCKLSPQLWRTWRHKQWYEHLIFCQAWWRNMKVFWHTDKSDMSLPVEHVMVIIKYWYQKD